MVVCAWQTERYSCADAVYMYGEWGSPWVHDDSARALACDAGVVVSAWQTERSSCADAVYMYGE